MISKSSPHELNEDTERGEKVSDFQKIIDFVTNESKVIQRKH